MSKLRIKVSGCNLSSYLSRWVSRIISGRTRISDHSVWMLSSRKPMFPCNRSSKWRISRSLRRRYLVATGQNGAKCQSIWVQPWRTQREGGPAGSRMSVSQ